MLLRWRDSVVQVSYVQESYDFVSQSFTCLWILKIQKSGDTSSRVSTDFISLSLGASAEIFYISFQSVTYSFFCIYFFLYNFFLILFCPSLKTTIDNRLNFYFISSSMQLAWNLFNGCTFYLIYYVWYLLYDANN